MPALREVDMRNLQKAARTCTQSDLGARRTPESRS
jgi:hypothetical protein